MESFFNNCSFFFLLCSMTFYWIRTFFNLSFFSSFGKITIILANLAMLCLFVTRGFSENGVHHFPVSNLYEALIFLSWSLTLLQLIFESNFSLNKNSFIMGALIAPTSLFLNAFASFQLPKSLHKISPLIPALQSNWLMMHVTVMLFSYATLIFGCILSIAFLFLKPRGYRLSSGPKNTDLSDQLDQLSFRSIGIGFPLLTIGILSGSVWANEAWGSYWSWDPKETWSLITWLIFAIYLHLRLTQKWNGFKSAILATIGFFVVWTCFLGVNFLAKGLHSYGWFSN